MDNYIRTELFDSCRKEDTGSMTIVIVFVFILGLILFWILRLKKKVVPSSYKPILKCPNCGSPVKLMVIRWECGYCGNSGSLKKSRSHWKNSLLLLYCATDLQERTPPKRCPFLCWKVKTAASVNLISLIMPTESAALSWIHARCCRVSLWFHCLSSAKRSPFSPTPLVQQRA